jgi:hypothetical protein
VTRTWRGDVIQKYFYPHDAEAILAIKLTQRPTDDFIAWNMEKQWTFYSQIIISIGFAAVFKSPRIKPI